MPTGKIVLKSEITDNIGQNQLNVEIITGGKTPAIVTLNENIGCPRIAEVYAKSIRISSDDNFVDGVRLNNVFDGIQLTINFDSCITSNALALVVNLFQEDAIEFKIPDSKKLNLTRA